MKGCDCLEYNPLPSVLVRLSGRKKKTSCPLFLKLLYPPSRNKMSKITLFCIGFDAECSSITNTRCISLNYLKDCKRMQINKVEMIKCVFYLFKFSTIM